MNNQIKVALIDDEYLFVEGLVLLLSTVANIAIVATATHGTKFLDDLMNIPENNFPDLVLVDLQMKPMNGFELVEILKDEYPDLKIIILSSHYKSNVLGHMIKLGVSAFLPKNSNLKLLVEAMGSVYKTGVFFSERDHQMLVAYMKAKPKNTDFNTSGNLSEREIEVTKLVCLEYTNEQIAEKLFISKRTVESHRQRILDKIGVKNTVGLVIYAITHEIYILPQNLGSV